MSDTAMDKMVLEFKNALLQIDRVKAANILEQCYVDKRDFPRLEQLIMESLDEIGQGWERGTVSLAQTYMSGIISEELINRYLPKDEGALEGENALKIAIAVLEDHHILGKKIVCSVLKAGGYSLLDFGQGLSPGKIVEKVLRHQTDILLISTLMLPSALKVTEVKKQLTEAGREVKIIVGGAPFRLDSELWQAVGADAKGDKATDAISLIERVWKHD